jgi:predicted HTH transcriptional regulator
MGFSMKKTKREAKHLYPVESLREALTNAIVHADYSQKGSPIRVAIFPERIEIDNPGGLMPGLTVEDMLQGVSKIRNRVIGQTFHELKYMERWGSGVQRMRQSCFEQKMPMPEFVELGHTFRVIFRLKESVQSMKELDSMDRAILDLLQGESLKVAEIAKKVKISTRALRERMRKLQKRGLVVEVGSGPQDPKKRYRLG